MELLNSDPRPALEQACKAGSIDLERPIYPKANRGETMVPSPLQLGLKATPGVPVQCRS